MTYDVFVKTKRAGVSRQQRGLTQEQVDKMVSNEKRYEYLLISSPDRETYYFAIWKGEKVLDWGKHTWEETKNALGIKF